MQAGCLLIRKANSTISLPGVPIMYMCGVYHTSLKYVNHNLGLSYSDGSPQSTGQPSQLLLTGTQNVFNGQ